ncbi:MAG: GNAT family N-acetyltransferase [Lachnospiraceae bacterium]|nr:GNAT family N-acetyltransferase [Lachnospiraceae bacterium]
MEYIVDNKNLTAEVFLEMMQKVWKENYNPECTKAALEKNINITAWNGQLLVGYIRILTDGYYFGTITELLVIPEYQRNGIGKKLMELASEATPTSLFFGAQPSTEAFYEKFGYLHGLASFSLKSKEKYKVYSTLLVIR